MRVQLSDNQKLQRIFAVLEIHTGEEAVQNGTDRTKV